MEYTVTRTQTNQAEILLVFNPDDISNAYEKAYKNAATKVKINGYRPGKAPLEMVKKILKDSVAEDAIVILINESLKNIYPKLDFTPYNQPRIQIEKFEKEKELIAKASVEIAPEVKLGNYKNLSLDTYEFEISESDVLEELENIRYNLAKTQAKEEGEVVEENDAIEIDLHIQNSEGFEIFHKDKFLYYMNREPKYKDFEFNFIGLKQGESKEFQHEYPENFFDSNLSGKKLFFKVVVHSIYKLILPEINDELAKEFSERTPDLETLKQEIRNALQISVQKQLRERYLAKLLEKVTENSVFHFPNSLLESEKQSLIQKDIEEFFGHEKVTTEELAKLFKVTPEKLNELYTEKALGKLKVYFALGEISKAENMKVDQEQFKENYNNYIAKKSQKRMNNQTLENIALNLYESMIFQKVFDFLIENADKQVKSGVSLREIKEILKEN